MTIGNTRVTLSLTAFVADTADLDEVPDELALLGTMTLEPQLVGGPLQFDDGGVNKLKAITSIPVQIGATGNIEHQGRDYVRVPAPTPEESNISALLQYKAVFTGMAVNNVQVQVPPIYFTATPGGSVNLADEIGIGPGATGVVTTRGPRGFGIVSVIEDSGSIIVTYDSDSGPVSSDPIPIPGGGGTGGGLDAEQVRDVIATALQGTGLVTVAPNDPANTIVIGTTATQNATDAFLRSRANHTDFQAISTVTNLQTTLDGKEDETNKGQPNGYAPLGPDSKVPTANLPTAAAGYTDAQADARITAANLYRPGGADVAVTDGGTGVGSLSGILKGNGTAAVGSAVAGTDYIAPGGSIAGSTGLVPTTGLAAGGVKDGATYLRSDNTWATPAGGSGGGPADWDTLINKPTTFPPQIGSTGSTAVAGNDSRMTNARTPTAHAHAWSEITSGVPTTFAPIIGSGATQAVAGNDPRLTDARTPTAHNHTAANVTDFNATVNGLITTERTTAATLSGKTISDKLDIVTTGTAPATPAGGTARFYGGQAKGLDAPAWINTLGVPFIVCRDSIFFAKNVSGATLTKGTAVYIQTASSGIPNINKAQGDSGGTKLPCVGVVAADITNNSVGAVMQKGVLSNINTGGMGDGSMLYVSPTTAGAFTNTRPTHPQLAQAIGVVEDANASTGVILVNVAVTVSGLNDGTNQPGWSVGDGTGSAARTVNFKNANTGTLSWQPTAARTINLPDAGGTVALTGHVHSGADITTGTLPIAAIPTGQTGTTVPLGNDTRFTDARTPTTHTHPVSQLSDASAVMKTMLVVPDGATARSAIGAGTSNLVLGTTAGTAKVGTYVPDWTEVANKPTTFAPQIGSTGSTAVAGNDPRLTDSRAPTAHSHPVGQITAGGTPGPTTFLRGDGSWEVPAGGAAAGTEVVIQNGTPGDAATDLWLDLDESPTVTYPVNSVAGKQGNVTLSKADVGLSLVDNTQDALKTVYAATRLATPVAINGQPFDGTGPITIEVGEGGGGPVPYDLSIIAFGAVSTRSSASGGTGDNPFGIKIARACAFTAITFRCITASGASEAYKIQKNGLDVSGMAASSVVIGQQNQGTGVTITGGPWMFSAGDILTLVCATAGTTPGKGLIADLTGTAT